ncbi:MAG: right-handed parallel beta-helix repeat-containing protein [Deltaproteobacteria bacterium]|nr:right-handed parallel beta-helix repeat-containing protein [Deltaproteobacteria bacterium]
MMRQWLFLGLMLATVAGREAFPVFAANCGGAAVCRCGDTVVADYGMTQNLGPCPRVNGTNADTIGLTVKSAVSLDCKGHAIVGPGDTLKNSFGIRAGSKSSPTPDQDVSIRNCSVSRFWWGVYVQNSTQVAIEGNTLHDNGWKDPTQNGTGYGLDVANSQFITVRNNAITDSGNEGFHLSHSHHVTVEDNVIADSGREQLYLYHADDNIVRRNLARGGTQGLEMRFSNRNAFSYNLWLDSPKQWLENDDTQNTFLYEHFDGMVLVGGKSTGNTFSLCEFIHPTGICFRTKGKSTTIYKGHFSSCLLDLKAGGKPLLDRCVGVDRTSGKFTAVYPGCVADFDNDGDVDAQDQTILSAALPSKLGSVDWNPEVDIDHDGNVDKQDQGLFTAALGVCPSN